MDLKQIRYFCAVADAGSFSAGARRAFVTQPTLSVAIAGLEDELGVTLFERRNRGATPTGEGRRLLTHARAVLRETEKLKAAGQEPARGRPLRLGLLPTLPLTLVTQVLARLEELDPGQTWQTEDASAAALHQRLSAGRYDVVLTGLARPAAGHRQAVLAGDALALAVPRNRRPSGRVTPEVLQDAPLIVRTHCEFLQPASRILDDWHVRPRVVARTDSDARALALVAAGRGACLMPDSFRHDDVAFVRPQGVTLRRRLGLEWIRGVAEGWFDERDKGFQVVRSGP